MLHQILMWVPAAFAKSMTLGERCTEGIMRVFRRVLGRQKGKAKKVIAALRKDSRPAVAADLSVIPKRTFWRNLKKIRDDFAQCYQAYRRSRRNRRVAHFSLPV